ncbi:LOG family protein [Leucobacter musarum]|uniref:LOG family protein n=1 Tax=Leucobacter musarum TaxID=1930747 RepID=UPI0018722FC3|nr:TIGR00730 family Rossman fold protein [Leucobacter musarum]
MSTEAQQHSDDPQAASTVVEAAAAHPEAVREQLDALIETAGAGAQRGLIRRILTAGLGLGSDGTSRLDLKITASAVEEMRAAFRLFAPFVGIPKVTIFGSARTQSQDPLWLGAEAAARGLAERGWMVVTGAGPGIMEAAATGAGPERSLGVSIRLPFEETPLDEPADDGHRVAMKYFFTRKLMLVKESRGFVCLPGGFGTMDETFELLTLQQTGKMEPMPIVLLDRAGGTYWRGFARFVIEELAGAGLISVDDLDRVLITDSPEAAIAEVIGFWRNYDSLRWQGEQLVLRVRAAPTDAEIADLNRRFAGLCETGEIARTEPLDSERADHDALDLHRIVFTPRRRAVGDLYRLIRALNELESAPAAE